MSEGVKSTEEKAAEARRGPPIPRRGPGAGIGAPVEKQLNFRACAVRLLESVQQTLSQLLTSLLTVVAMVTMMFIISPLLALVALITIPVDIGLTAVIGKRAQKLFIRQRKHTGGGRIPSC